MQVIPRFFWGSYLYSLKLLIRDYWMIYRRPGFLAVVDFGSSPTHLSSASCLSFSFFLCVAGRAYWRGGGVGEEPNAYDNERAWSSINHSILSGWKDIIHYIQFTCWPWAEVYSMQLCRKPMQAVPIQLLTQYGRGDNHTEVLSVVLQFCWRCFSPSPSVFIREVDSHGPRLRSPELEFLNNLWGLGTE